MKKEKVYIAGPGVFAPDDLEMGSKKVAICEKYGLEGIYPSFLLPDDIFTGNHDKDYIARVINKSCIDGIKDCDILIADVTPFRGLEIDSGTAFEIGVGYALGKKLYGYSKDNRTYVERMQQSGGGTFKNGQNKIVDKDGYVIENLDEGENCMIAKSFLSKMVTPARGQNLSLLELFEKTVILAKWQLESDKKFRVQDSSIPESTKKTNIFIIK